MNTQDTPTALPQLPPEPSPGLLMSMALRLDHALGAPGYYDEMSFGRIIGPSHAQRLEGALASMRQIYEEVSGQGFYRPDKEDMYATMAQKALEKPQPDPSTHLLHLRGLCAGPDTEPATETIRRARDLEPDISMGPSAASPWQPIETAPKDGTHIDLWMDGEFPGRHPDCYWGKPPHECGEMGQYCDSDHHDDEPGWIDSTFGEYIGTTAPPTHWMPVPTGPGKEASK